jgi:hypothetical protein
MQPKILTRGLAASAVGALAITGLTVAPAHAVGPDATFISIFNASHRASTRVDGDAMGTRANSAITLTGIVDMTDSPEISFEYNTNPAADGGSSGWTSTMASITTTGDFVRADWTTAGGLAGTSIAVRLAASTVDGTTYAIRNNVAVTGSASAVNSVLLTGVSGGYFPQPYTDSSRTRTLTTVSGTTSATSGNVGLSWWRASDGTFQGQVDAAVSPASLKVSFPSSYVDGGRFSGALDITAFGADPGDVLALAAQRDTDDVVPVSLYQQDLMSTGASAGSPTASGTPVVVYVNDQSGNYVAGAEVRRMSDGGIAGYTNGAGVVNVTQPNDTTETYYVNATDNDAYEGGTDLVTDPVTTDPFVPVATATEAVLADGPVFDDDEYTNGDIALQVVDQDGSPFTGEAEVSYALYKSGTTPPTPTSATTNANGRLVIPFNASSPDGEYTLDFTNPTGAPSPNEYSQTFVHGDATLSLSPGAGSAASGGQITYHGSFAVDGEPIAGRTIALGYKRGTELVPGTGADAGMTGVGGALSGSVTTAGNGTFTVVVKDPAEAGKPTETGGKLTATAVAAKETTSSLADFGSGKGGVPIKLTGSSKGAKDNLVITTPASGKGEKVTILRKIGGGKWTELVTKVLGATGLKVSLKDPNGAKPVSYKATVEASDRAKSTTSKTLKLK